MLRWVGELQKNWVCYKHINDLLVMLLNNPTNCIYNLVFGADKITTGAMNDLQNVSLF